MRSLKWGEALSLRSKRVHPGDVFGKLSGFWLADVGGGGRGAAYHFSKATTQVLIAFVTGLSTATPRGSTSAIIFAIILSSLQCLLGLFFLLLGPSGDRIEGAATGLEFLTFGIAAAFAVIPTYRTVSSILLLVAPNFAIMLSLYDVLLLPLLGACLEKDGRAGLKASLYASLLLPFEVIMSHGPGIGGSVGNVVNTAMELEGGLAETAASVTSGASAEHALVAKEEGADTLAKADDEEEGGMPAEEAPKPRVYAKEQFSLELILTNAAACLWWPLSKAVGCIWRLMCGKGSKELRAELDASSQQIVELLKEVKRMEVQAAAMVETAEMNAAMQVEAARGDVEVARLEAEDARSQARDFTRETHAWARRSIEVAYAQVEAARRQEAGMRKEANISKDMHAMAERRYNSSSTN